MSSMKIHAAYTHLRARSLGFENAWTYIHDLILMDGAYWWI